MALDFNGTTDQVNYGDLNAFDGATALSICLWVNPDTVTPTHIGWLTKAPAASSLTFKFGTHYSVTSAVDVWFNSTPILGRTATGALVLNEWHHFACTYNGGGANNDAKLQIYKDGVAQALSFEGTIPTAITDGGTSPVHLGMQDLNNVFFNGKLAHLKIWSAHLTAAEIAQEVHSFRPVRTSNLLLWSTLESGEI